MEENKQPQANEPQKSQANLALQQAIDTLQAEDTTENRKKMLGVAAVSRYLVPVTLTPPPPRGGHGPPGGGAPPPKGRPRRGPPGGPK